MNDHRMVIHGVVADLKELLVALTLASAAVAAALQAAAAAAMEAATCSESRSGKEIGATI